MRGASVGGWFLSRRDTIVARHFVPGSAVWTFKGGTLGDLCPKGGHRAESSSPFGARPFGPRHDSSQARSAWKLRYFVPGYYRAVPPGQNPFSQRGASELS
jgi:hypothetical protein